MRYKRIFHLRTCKLSIINTKAKIANKDLVSLISIRSSNSWCKAYVFLLAQLYFLWAIYGFHFTIKLLKCNTFHI